MCTITPLPVPLPVPLHSTRYIPCRRATHRVFPCALLLIRLTSPRSAFYEHGVDIALAGHVHAYERTLPVAFGSTNPCGTVHLTLGDGGNREGVSLPWVEPPPDWSAMRRSVFRHRKLLIVNSTHGKSSPTL